MTCSPTIEPLVSELAAAILPPARIPLSEWADRNRRLSSEASAQVGQWATLPYQREPMDCIGAGSKYERVVLMWASQVGKTEMLLNRIAYAIAEDPGPMLSVQPNLDMADAFSKDRLAPMFRDMPALKGKVADPKSRDSGSTILHRRFMGGHLTIVSAKSAAGLASRPIRLLLLDELDRFDESAGAEGDPVELAEARTASYWNRLIVAVSSPTVKGSSRIETAFLESDQRYYFVPCPLCSHMQRLIWARVEWPEGDPARAFYRCERCEQPIDHHRKMGMLSRGEWRASNPSSRIAGFQLSALYSPWRSWAWLAEKWLSVQGDRERLQAFLNTQLAELWDDSTAGSVTEAELMARRESYGPRLPDRAAIVTAGVDVQDDRVEVSVYAWGAGEESWLMSHRVFRGDPSTPSLWAALDEELLQTWEHPIVGRSPIHAACVDSGGHFTAAVTRFCDERMGRRVWAIKGAPGARPAWPKRQSKAAKGKVWLIGVDSLKQTLQHRLRIDEGTSGRIHFPLTVELPFFEQLNSEFLRTEYRQGVPVRTWERRKGRAAEVWDCSVYALAALHGLMAHGVHVDVEAAKIEAARVSGVVQTPAYQVYRSRFVSGA